jgi:hypothetical protein
VQRRLHPRALFVRASRGGEVCALTVAAPIRGQALRITTVTRAEEPGLFHLLHRMSTTGVSLAEVDARWIARLTEVGALVSAAQTPRPVRFRAPFRSPPRALLPQPCPVEPRALPGDLRVHAGLRVAAGPLPEALAPSPSIVLHERVVALAAGPVNPLDPACGWALVPHAGRPMPSLWSLGPAALRACRRLAPGEPPARSLGAAAVRALHRAGVLVDPGHEARSHRVLRAACAAASAELAQRGLTVLRGLFHPLQLASLRRYYRRFVAEGYVEKNRKVSFAHNEPLSRFFHGALAGFASELCGEPMKASYTYLVAYAPGDGLARHLDRPQCALTVSVLLDYAPEPHGDAPWPLHVEMSARKPGRRVEAIRAGVGDAIAFRGTELPHFRDPLPAGHASTSLLLHYVPAGFAGSLD